MWTRTRPANVTAAVMDRNNRARSVAAGVVSGAGGQPVLQKPHSDESAPSRTRQSLDPNAFGAQRRELGLSFQQGSWSGTCVLTGGAGHIRTYERGDGSNLSECGGGRVESFPPARLGYRRKAAPAKHRHGDVNGFGKGRGYEFHDNVRSK